jgi:DNA repair protein RecN (Recombination protein N)
MLLSLTIRDVVLIERLDLAFPSHLSVLTGETGAGKSILLDALGLALGSRADSGLVRKGAAQAVVIASFEVLPDDPVQGILRAHDIPVEDTLVLRRVLNADGRSRGFVNDQPASVSLMKQIGDMMVEIQGQFEQRGLLDPSNHRALLDAFIATPSLIDAVSTAWEAWRSAREARRDAEAAASKAASDEAFLRHAIDELNSAKPQPGEEAALALRRTSLMHRAQIAEAVESALKSLSGDRGAESALNNAERLLDRVRDKAAGTLTTPLATLERAIVETVEAISQLESVQQEDDVGSTLESVEARLFDLRSLARKHGVTVDALADLQQSIAQKLAAIDDGGTNLRHLVAAEQHSRAQYRAEAARLSEERRRAAQNFDQAVQAELVPLKLDRARFATSLSALDESDWGPHGVERVTFEVATNPGSAPGPLARIASGGELSRFLLALKVVLARVSSVPTIVFDEVDSGIGGAVAAAVGERLQRLGEELQVLVVTHSPQVAARGMHHWRVAKQQAAETTTTRVDALEPHERREEIARMLSGAKVTDEARAAASMLLNAAAA